MIRPQADGDACRLAAIDVGSNSIRLVVAELLPDRSFRLVDDERVPIRLGRGLSAEGRLDPDVLEHAARTIAHLRTIADGCGIARLRAVATSAVREAANRDDFLQAVREHAELELEVISPETEARLAYLSVARAFDLRSSPVAVIDIGGGSTELVLSSGPAIEQIIPLPLGAVRLTERFGLGGAIITDDDFRRMQRRTRKTVRRALADLPFVPHLVVGTGGTFTNLAGMSMHGGASANVGSALPLAVRGYELQRSEVKHILHRLRKMSLRERSQVPGLSPQRADIIVAGLTIIDTLLKHLSANRLRVHDQGIRAGLLHEMIDELRPADDPVGDTVVDRMKSVRRFAASCHRDELHADHVADLALLLFDGLAREIGGDAAWASSDGRDLLHAASLLHDVGYLVSYARHHKHSYHLIMHSPVCGFTRRDLAIIANVARYHRGARPKASHGNFAQLSREDREIVRRLASILRLAVGLDRSHAQRVHGLTVSCRDDIALIDVESDGDPQVEVWGAERKSRLFESAFDMKPRFHWRSDAVRRSQPVAGADPPPHGQAAV